MKVAPRGAPAPRGAGRHLIINRVVRRLLLIIVTTIAALGAASAAHAAIDRYSAKLAFGSQIAGSASRPSPVGFTEALKMRGTGGNRPGVLTHLTTKIYGLSTGIADFPTCAIKQIRLAASDRGCPAGALLATGYLTGEIGATDDFGAGAAPCNPAVHVWNSGGLGRLTFFLVENGAHQCLGGALKSGAVGPYPGTALPQGKYLAIDSPIPPTVGYPFQFFAFSVQQIHLTWRLRTIVAQGETVSAFASVGCDQNRRPSAVTFTATMPGIAPQTTTAYGHTPCARPVVHRSKKKKHKKTHS